VAQTIRSSKLENRFQRLKLPIQSRNWVSGGSKGLSLGYRRAAKGYGMWEGRVRLKGRYHFVTLGTADDYQEGEQGYSTRENATVLTYRQAQDKLALWAQDLTTTPSEKRKIRAAQKTNTVRDASEHYMKWFRNHRKNANDTQRIIDVHILPSLGSFPLADLDKLQLEEWRDKLANTPARKRSKKGAAPAFREKPLDEDGKRARKASANRILTVLKAILNKAFEDTLVDDDKEWRKVKPFRKVEESAVRFLSADEVVRLINACGSDLRELVKAALFTGARRSEIARLRRKDVNLDTGHVYISSQAKGGRGRQIPLNTAGRDFFKSACQGKDPADILFTKADGQPWGINNEQRPLAKASENARITPAVTFHNLRHTYGSSLAQEGVDLLLISKLLGHKDTRVTAKHYGHLTDSTLAAAVSTKLPSFGHISSDKVQSLR